MELMKLNVECYAGRKADEQPIRSGSKEDSITSRRCWTSGTTQRASFIWFAPMTGTSMFFGNKLLRLMECGIWFRFARTLTHRKLPEPGDPHLPAIERKVQSADEHPCNRQGCCRNVRVDQLIQIMEQEPTPVRLNSSLGFQPVL